MKWWPWKRSRATKADLLAAETAVQRAQSDWDEVAAVKRRVQKLRQRNGFADNIRTAMGAQHK